jgi:hypothetical protein
MTPLFVVLIRDGRRAPLSELATLSRSPARRVARSTARGVPPMQVLPWCERELSPAEWDSEHTAPQQAGRRGRLRLLDLLRRSLRLVAVLGVLAIPLVSRAAAAAEPPAPAVANTASEACTCVPAPAPAPTGTASVPVRQPAGYDEVWNWEAEGLGWVPPALKVAGTVCKVLVVVSVVAAVLYGLWRFIHLRRSWRDGANLRRQQRLANELEALAERLRAERIAADRRLESIKEAVTRTMKEMNR